jgi:hypothetical protein
MISGDRDATRLPGHRAGRVGMEASLTVEVHAVRDAHIDLCQDEHIIYLNPEQDTSMPRWPAGS